MSILDPEGSVLIKDSLDHGGVSIDQSSPQAEKPLAIRGYLTRTALAHKLKLISGADLEKKYVIGKVTDVAEHEILQQARRMVRPVVNSNMPGT